MFYVYILRSKLKPRHYIGFTSNLDKRLAHHNEGLNRSTKPLRPWEVIYYEQYATKEEAWKREKQIKSYKGGRAFKALLE